MAYDFKGYFPMRFMNMLLGSVIPKGVNKIYGKIKEQEQNSLVKG